MEHKLKVIMLDLVDDMQQGMFDRWELYTHFYNELYTRKIVVENVEQVFVELLNEVGVA